MMRIAALLCGLLIDWIVGDPDWFPHPVRFIGAYISRMESFLRKHCKNLRFGAVILTATTTILTMLITAIVMAVLSLLGGWVRFLGMTVIAWLCISSKCLAKEAKGVMNALHESLEKGRKQVGRIVGRDTAELTADEIVKATIETVAENTTDGVVSPMIFFALGGPVLAMGFKAASTLDSMVGYLDEKYRDIGWSSAKLDDGLNYLPARLTAILMCAACALLGYDAKNAWKIVKRDHANHKSPNCAWSEAAAAGALHIQLGGTHLYFGKPVEKPTIGDADRPAEETDIEKTNRMLYLTSAMTALLIVAVSLLF